MSAADVKVDDRAVDGINFCNLDEFMKTVVQQMPFSGVSGAQFYTCEKYGVRYLVKVVPHFNSMGKYVCGADTKTIPTAAAEIRILEILKRAITIPRLSPCVVEIIRHQTCSVHSFAENIPCSDVLIGPRKDVDSDLKAMICNVRDQTKINYATGDISFIVLDRCDMGLDDFIQKIGVPALFPMLKGLIFQMVHLFATILKIYPRFRHRDIHSANFMIKIDSGFEFRLDQPRCLEFWWGSGESATKFYVPFFGMYAKLIDFGFASIPEEGVFSAVEEDKLQLSRRADNDIIFLFNWIYHTLPRNMPGNITAMVDRLLAKLDPSKSYSHRYYVPIINENAHATPIEMMDSSVWREYKKQVGTVFATYRL